MHILKNIPGNHNLNKQELLLIHLLNYDSQKNDYMVTEELTAKGIEKILDCSQSYVVKILQYNISQGYIKKVLRKVRNRTRKLNVYFLTDKGKKLALKINDTMIRSLNNKNSKK